MVATWILVGIALVAGGILYIENMPPPNGTYDAFAKCIANTSTTFYGAWWCPHCHEQKNEFGDAAQYLPYVECAASDTSEKQSCVDLGIKNYPTWVFPDNTSSTGIQTLQTLSEKTNCKL